MSDTGQRRWGALFIDASGWGLLFQCFGWWLIYFAGPNCVREYRSGNILDFSNHIPASDGWCTFAAGDAGVFIGTLSGLIGLLVGTLIWWLIGRWRPEAVPDDSPLEG